MARRRFRHQRRELDSERAIYSQTIYTSHTLHRQELLNLIRGGEDTYTEFKVRLSNPEKITAEIVALANTGGGAIVFGVDDQRRVEGLDNIEAVEEQLVEICRSHIVPPLVPYLDKVAFDNGKRIVVLELRPRNAPYATLDGRFYLRFGSVKQEATREEVMQLYNDHRPIEFENMPLVSARINDIDEAHLWSYVRALRGAEFGRKDDYPTEQVLKDMGLAASYTNFDDANLVPTLGGLLLFGYFTRVPEVFPRASVIATRYAGTTITDPVVERVELSGNLSIIFERALSFIARYVDLRESRAALKTEPSAAEGSFVVARGNYQRSVIVEGLTNALVHRDYSIREVYTRLSIFDNRIELINPCRPQMQSIESIRYGVVNAPNPRLKAIFKQPLYGLTLPPGGVPLLLQTGRAFSGHAPEIKIINGEFRLRVDAC